MISRLPHDEIGLLRPLPSHPVVAAGDGVDSVGAEFSPIDVLVDSTHRVQQGHQIPRCAAEGWDAPGLAHFGAVDLCRCEGHGRICVYTCGTCTVDVA